MINRTKISLLAGAALIGLAMATPASAAPSGSYQQTCRDIQERYGQTLTAECQTRNGSWQQTRLENDRCDGDIANIDGRLVCSDNGGHADRTDRMHGDRYTSGGEGDYGDTQRHDDYGYRFDRGYNDRQPDGDPYAYNRPYGETYGDRRYDDRGYAGDDVLSRGRLIRRLERQGYYGAHDLRPVRWGDDWRALAIWRGHRVVVRLNPHNGRVIAARYI